MANPNFMSTALLLSVFAHSNQIAERELTHADVFSAWVNSHMCIA